jgi:hypothetical protein
MNDYPIEGLTGVTPADLTWMTGSWRAVRDDKIYEESWSGLDGGTLIAMFRSIQDDKIRFYEFQTISQVGAHVHLRIKHFSADLIGWEERDKFVDFVLVRLEGNEAVFMDVGKPNTWMLYRLESEDNLFACLETVRDGEKAEFKFDFKRQTRV